MTLWAAFFALLLDRITKILAVKILLQGQSIKIIPGVFHFTLVLNRGAAFGIFKGQTALFIALSLLAIVFILIYTLRKRREDPLLSLSLGLVLGGAAGNLIDRIMFVYVIDFFDFRVWPVFNIADSCITIGMFFLMARAFLKPAD